MIHPAVILDHEYDVIAVEGSKEAIANAEAWCWDTFGPAGDRWFYRTGKFYFKNSRDAMWFELKY